MLGAVMEGRLGFVSASGLRQNQLSTGVWRTQPSPQWALSHRTHVQSRAHGASAGSITSCSCKSQPWCLWPELNLCWTRGALTHRVDYCVWHCRKSEHGLGDRPAEPGGRGPPAALHHLHQEKQRVTAWYSVCAWPRGRGSGCWTGLSRQERCPNCSVQSPVGSGPVCMFSVLHDCMVPRSLHISSSV
jgi:hypothetical protein